MLSEDLPSNPFCWRSPPSFWLLSSAPWCPAAQVRQEFCLLSPLGASICEAIISKRSPLGTCRHVKWGQKHLFVLSETCRSSCFKLTA